MARYFSAGPKSAKLLRGQTGHPARKPIMETRSRPLEVGNTAPGFALETPYGVETTLASLLMDGPLLVEFVRGTWDPDTRKRLTELTACHERFRHLHSKVVVVLCERRETVDAYLADHPVPFPVLIDGDRNVTRAYGVWKRFSLPMWNLARPSSFLMDRCGYVQYAYVARLQIHTASLEEIFAVLETMTTDSRT